MIGSIRIATELRFHMFGIVGAEGRVAVGNEDEIEQGALGGLRDFDVDGAGSALESGATPGSRQDAM